MLYFYITMQPLSFPREDKTVKIPTIKSEHMFAIYPTGPGLQTDSPLLLKN